MYRRYLVSFTLKTWKGSLEEIYLWFSHRRLLKILTSFILFFLPLIGKPTRITTNTTTLIDNIFTNVFDDKAACINGLLCADISDHIPIFHIHKLSNEILKENKKIKCIS